MSRSVSEAEPLDPRSTQRKRARKILFREEIPYICGAPHYREGAYFCKHSPTKLPENAPQTLELAPVGMRIDGLALQANHISKDIMDNDLVNLEWLCASCHKLEDSKTGKGVSQKSDPHGYEL